MLCVYIKKHSAGQKIIIGCFIYYYLSLAFLNSEIPLQYVCGSDRATATCDPPRRQVKEDFWQQLPAQQRAV